MKQKYWYHFTIYICVLCGRETIYRERRYTPKPKKYEERYELHEDGCSDHFL